MAKASAKTLFVCAACGSASVKWMGRCPSCGEWDSLVEERASAPAPSTTVASQPPVPYPEVEDQVFDRRVTGNREFDRVLGGGIVRGSVVLLGGEPGIGKSTLLLQIAELLSSLGDRVLYVAGEESARQIKMRGDRLGVSGANLFISPQTCLEEVFGEIERLQPTVLIVDSIQTVYTQTFESVPGSIGQIRECAMQFLAYAKKTHVPTFLIGHVTKDGSLAGPKALEHIVDVVLYFEGDRHHNQKLVRTVKNRFGPANELGIFEMTSRGLQSVENPSRLFLSERAEEVSGSVVLCAIQGSRPVLVELQALVSRTNFSTGRRTANGVDPNRVSLLLAMLEKRLGFHLLGSDVFINVAGGLTLGEPAVDLALVAAVVSSFRDLALPPSTVIFGEVGLAGEVRSVSFPHVRVKEAANMGFERVLLPRGNLPLSESIGGVKLQGIALVDEFLGMAGLA
ncbi:MAG: DNA repair protein RadA [Acidobacteriota bacterium]